MSVPGFCCELPAGICSHAVDESARVRPTSVDLIDLCCPRASTFNVHFMANVLFAGEMKTNAITNFQRAGIPMNVNVFSIRRSLHDKPHTTFVVHLRNFALFIYFCTVKSKS